MIQNNELLQCLSIRGATQQEFGVIKESYMQSEKSYRKAVLSLGEYVIWIV